MHLSSNVIVLITLGKFGRRLVQQMLDEVYVVYEEKSLQVLINFEIFTLRPNRHTTQSERIEDAHMRSRFHMNVLCKLNLL